MRAEKVAGTLQDIVFYPGCGGSGCVEIKRQDGELGCIGFGQAVLVSPDTLKFFEDKSRTGKEKSHVVKIPEQLIAKGSLVDLDA